MTAEGSIMPAVFVGHGSPMNTLGHNHFTQAWSDFGRSIPRPKAILAISAHWYIDTTAVTSMTTPETITTSAAFPMRFSRCSIPHPEIQPWPGRLLRS
jgi:4,5-DOPA dioxygenase extradiol